MSEATVIGELGQMLASEMATVLRERRCVTHLVTHRLSPGRSLRGFAAYPQLWLGERKSSDFSSKSQNQVVISQQPLDQF